MLLGFDFRRRFRTVQGFFGSGDTNTTLSLLIVAATALAVTAAAVVLLVKGWKIRT